MTEYDILLTILLSFKGEISVKRIYMKAIRFLSVISAIVSIINQQPPSRR